MAQTIRPSPNQVPTPVTRSAVINSSPVAVALSAAVNPTLHQTPLMGAGMIPVTSNSAIHQSLTVTTGAAQVQTPTTNNTTANQSPMANSNPIPLNFTTGNQVQARPQQCTTFAPSTVTGAHQPTPNPVITPGHYAPVNTTGHWGYFHGITPNGVPAGIQPSFPNTGKHQRHHSSQAMPNSLCTHHTRKQTKPQPE